MSGQDDLIFLYLGRLAFASVATLSQFHYCDYLETEVLHTSGNGLWWTTRTEVCSFFFRVQLENLRLYAPLAMLSSGSFLVLQALSATFESIILRLLRTNVCFSLEK